MHIADGIIDIHLSIAAGVVSVSLVYFSGRKLQAEEIPVMGITGAALFVSSLLHIPIAGTSIHPGLFGLAGIILGLRAFPVIFSVLLLQTFIFQHGGLFVLVINALNMGAGAFFAWLLWRVKHIPEIFRSFLAGFVGIMLPAMLMAIEFRLSGYGMGIFYIFSVYIVLALLEGVLAVSIVKFFKKVKSDIIN